VETRLRVERDDFRDSGPPGTVSLRDPKPAPPSTEPGSYEVLLDGNAIWCLADSQAVVVAVMPGDHVLATKPLADDAILSEVPFTVEADSYWDITTFFYCDTSGMLDGPRIGKSRETSAPPRPDTP
jgi:hypothetical protein